VNAPADVGADDAGVFGYFGWRDMMRALRQF
jgi:hypothetical protein